MKKWWAILLLIALLPLGGCAVAFQNEFNDLDTQTIEHDAGYSLLLPADWILAEADDRGELYYSADGAVSLSLLRELGGVEYYSLQEVGDMLCEDIGSELFSVVEPGAGKVKDDVYRRIIGGEDKDGNPLVSDVCIFAPYVSVRYYLVFTAASATYEENRNVIDGIAGSFTITKSEEETFQYLEAEREAAATAEQAQPTDESGATDNTGGTTE